MCTRDLWLCTVNYLVKTRILYYAYTYVYDHRNLLDLVSTLSDLQFKFRPHQLAYDPKVVINMYIHTHNRMNIFIQYPLNIAAGAWLAKTSAEGSALQCLHYYSAAVCYTVAGESCQSFQSLFAVLSDLHNVSTVLVLMRIIVQLWFLAPNLS